MELTVKVDPVSEVKQPVIVENVGTLMEDRTVKDEVTCASWEIRKFDWIELVVRVDPISEVPLIELTVKVEPVREVKQPVIVENVGTQMDEQDTIDEYPNRVFVNMLVVTTVEPSNVENEPDVKENDEIIRVELTVNVSTTMFALDTEENNP